MKKPEVGPLGPAGAGGTAEKASPKELAAGLRADHGQVSGGGVWASGTR